MMLDSVPNVSSAWSGTGTVVVVLPERIDALRLSSGA